YLAGAGWVQLLVIASYAAWLTTKLLEPKGSALWRRRVWLLFSVVFFAQLFLGLAGLEGLLMTGELHLPVPAVILAGPIYRGTGLFMPVLFTVTALLVGPAWCSHLCYFGAWDDLACRSRRRPQALPSKTWAVRLGITVAVVAVAVTLRLAGASTMGAAASGLAFGFVGVAVILLWSRRSGVMAHCVVYCPMGLVANLLGKLSPFRIRIKDDCTLCGACGQVCRYDALSKGDLQRQRPGLTCSLCGDCIGACPNGQLEYRFGGLRGTRARTLFIVLAASLHAVFLALARV
ncbi:MAG: 4Fe-4S ferredoxin, partial [Deltaproteobacteria bacterium]